MVSLHFMMETSPTNEVDTLFNQLIGMYDLPTGAEEARDGTYTGSSAYDACRWRIRSHLFTLQVQVCCNGGFNEGINLIIRIRG